MSFILGPMQPLIFMRSQYTDWGGNPKSELYNHAYNCKIYFRNKGNCLKQVKARFRVGEWGRNYLKQPELRIYENGVLINVRSNRSYSFLESLDVKE